MASLLIPQNTIGLPLSFSSGTFNMTGLTAKVFIRENPSQINASPTVVTLVCTVAPPGITATYTTVGGEFAGISGYCDAELKVYNGSLLLYSAISPNAFNIQPVLG